MPTRPEHPPVDPIPPDRPIPPEIHPPIHIPPLPILIPVATRRNVADLARNDMAEFRRFAIAFTRLKASGDDNSCVNAIHGGGFPVKPQYEQIFKPMAQWYSQEFGGPNGLTQGSAWNASAFCAHGVPIFMIWHRPYMRCFELLLQKYDPNHGQPAPLALHYWSWDFTPNGPLPDWATNPNFFGDIPNPFISGKQDPLHGSGQTHRAAKWPGIGTTLCNEVYHAYNDTNRQYYQVCTQNGPNNAVNFESPHNTLHNTVGGPTGDMTNPTYSSWDPIFWLHHSNVERQQFAWIHHHGTPTRIVAPGDTSFTNNTHLYPFPSRATFTTQGVRALPWTRPADKTNLSTVGEWFSNFNIGYTYDADGLVHFGVRSSIRLHHITLPNGDRVAPVKKIFNVGKVPVRGSGTIKGHLKIGRTTVHLPEKGIFTFKREVVCANCESRDLTLSWELLLTPEQAAAHHTATLEAFTFEDADISHGIEPGWFDETTGHVTAIKHHSRPTSSSSSSPEGPKTKKAKK